MIETATVSGRPAQVAYIGANHEPVEPAQAVLIKVLFTDAAGGIAFLQAGSAASMQTSYLWERTKRDALRNLSTSQRFAIARAQAEQTLARLREFDESQHPRDETGKWTDGGGGETGSGGGKDKDSLEGYSDKAKLKDGVIHTSDVYDAVLALSQDRKVELKQPKQLSTLVKKLGEIAKDMVAKGEKAPDYDLCKVTVKGTNLFCADTKGIPRIKMPQMDDVQTKAFIEHLKAEGYSVEKDKEKSENLRATQNQLIGPKVAKFYKRIRKDPEGKGDDKRLVVSRDDYVLDGHHHWAAQIAADAEDNKLGDHKTKVYRVDIGITKLLEEALKFTGGKGAKGTDDKAARWARARAEAEQALARLRKGEWNEELHPREPDGKFTESGGGDGGGAADKPETDKPAETAPAPAAGSGGGGKKKADLSDFAKDDVHVVGDSVSSPEKTQKFLQKWNDNIAEAPAEFKKEFLGGLPATMQVRYVENEDVISVNGKLLDEKGDSIGTYSRDLDFNDKKGVSSFFQLKSGAQGKGTGKVMLAANAAMYQKLGFDRIEVHANIDVGGKAWAKYGYVPTRSSWPSLSGDIIDKIDELSSGGSGGSYRADSWGELGSQQQSQIERAWQRSTHSDFLDSEIENWRENGQPLEDAKTQAAEQFNEGEEQGWAESAIDGYRKARAESGEPDIPFTNDQLIEAITLDYSSRYQDGKGDVDVTFDDGALDKPTTGDDPNQQTLPGIEPVKPHERLTEQMRDGLTSALDKGFEREADSNADNMDPPDYLADSVKEYQEEYWSSMDDDDKYDWAKRNAEDYLGSDDGESSGTGEIDDADADALRALASSSDPKALWQIADSKWGEKLLLGTDWYGAIDFKDKETMDRFHAYVGKAKK